VLLRIAANNDITVREIALAVGITERATQRIAADLVGAGIIDRQKRRKNHYTVNRDAAMRHAAQAEHHIGPLLELFRAEPKATAVEPVGSCGSAPWERSLHEH